MAPARPLSNLRPLETAPFVSIVIPTFNEELFVEKALRCALAQDYPANRMEILVADGRSTDRTRQLVAALASTDARVRLVDNPARIQSCGMNEAIRASRGAVIVRMDAHTAYATDYVSQSVAALRQTGAANVGGAMRAVPRNRFQKALCLALRSPLGVGGAAYRDPDAEGEVDTVYNGAFRREVFESVGLYDEGAVTNEDAELNDRIRAAGGKVYLSSRIVSHYDPRDGYRRLARQYFAYGVGRARTTCKHGAPTKIRSIIPFFMVTGFGVGAVAAALLPALRRPLRALSGVYAATVVAEAVRVTRGEGIHQAPLVATMFPVLHVSHGFGFAAGLWRYLWHPDWTNAPETLTPSVELPSDPVAPGSAR